MSVYRGGAIYSWCRSVRFDAAGPRAKDLPNSTHAKLTRRGHGQIFNVNPCALTLMRDLFDDPKTNLILTCVKEERVAPIVLPSRMRALEIAAQ